MTGGAPAGRDELDRALSTGAVLLAAMYIVARTAANQFSPYSGESAFAGLIAVLLGLCVAIKSFVTPRPLRLPNSLVLFAVIWSGIFIWAALRSPNPGIGIPLAGDAGTYLLLLLCGYLLAASDSGGLVHLFA